MAWSYSVRLRDFHDAPREPGIYEIGFTRNNIFNFLYVGKAETNIYDRLKAHYTGTSKGSKKVNDYLIKMERDNLWCHWMRVSDPGYMEANLQNQFGIRDDGLYRFNDRLEKTKKKRR